MNKEQKVYESFSGMDHKIYKVSAGTADLFYHGFKKIETEPVNLVKQLGAIQKIKWSKDLNPKHLQNANFLNLWCVVFEEGFETLLGLEPFDIVCIAQANSSDLIPNPQKLIMTFNNVKLNYWEGLEFSIDSLVYEEYANCKFEKQNPWKKI